MPVITAAAYNTIRESIAGRVGNVSVYNEYGSLTTPLTTSGGYGRSFTSDIVVGGNTVGVSDTVTEEQYFNLWLDLQAAYVHQNGTLSTDSSPTEFEGSITYPSAITSRDTISQSEIDNLTLVANDVLSFNHASTEFPSSSFTGLEPLETSGGVSTSSTRTTSWGGSSDATKIIRHDVTVNFGDHSSMIYFLAAGGEINFQSTATGGTTGTANTKDWDWARILSEAGTVRFRRVNQTTWECEAVSPGTGTGYSNATIGSGTTWTKVFEKRGGGVTGGNPGVIPVEQIYDDNYFRIYARTNSAFASATQLQFRIELDDGDIGTGGQQADGFIGPRVDESVTATITSTVYTKTPASTFTYGGNTYNGIVLAVPPGTKDSDF